MGLIDAWRAGVAQGKREEADRQILERHAKERAIRQSAANPPPLSQAFGKATVKARPIAAKVQPLAKAVSNWVFTGSTDGVRRGQYARNQAQAPASARSTRRSMPPPRERVVYVREPASPRRARKKPSSDEPDYSGWGAGWGKL